MIRRLNSSAWSGHPILELNGHLPEKTRQSLWSRHTHARSGFCDAKNCWQIEGNDANTKNQTPILERNSTPPRRAFFCQPKSFRLVLLPGRAFSRGAGEVAARRLSGCPFRRNAKHNSRRLCRSPDSTPAFSPTPHPTPRLRRPHI